MFKQTFMVATHLLSLSCLAASAADDLPKITQKWCADSRDFLQQNNVTVQDIRYRLCMDRTNVKYYREDKCSSERTAPCAVIGESAYSVSNGTVSWTITPTAPGIYTCKFGPASAQSALPFSFINLDPTTKLNGTVQLDGKTAEDWLSDRKPGTPGHGGNEEFMHWYLDHDSEAPTKDALRADCVQTVKGTATTTSGNRDWSANYTRDVDDSIFEFETYKAKVGDCSGDVPKPWVPATDCAPACASGTLCCKDPKSIGKGEGACYKVSSCASIHDGIKLFSGFF